MEFLEDLTKEPSLTNLRKNQQPNTENKYLQLLGEPHVQSFNFMLNEGIQQAIDDLIPLEFELLNGDRIKIAIEKATFQSPEVPVVHRKGKIIYPSECRQRAVHYQSKFLIDFSLSINGQKQKSLTKDLGYVPIVVKSDICNLANLTPNELIKKHEHPGEWGGYFIIGGHEKLIRMLIMTRRNYPIAVCRSSWKKRGELFSDKGVMVRCVQKDETETTNVLHFTTDGTAKLMFSYLKRIYYVSVVLMLKALIDTTDLFIFKCLMFGHEEDFYYKSCLMEMLRELHTSGIHTHQDAKEYVGGLFRVSIECLPPWATNIDACDFILKHCLAIHLDKNMDKFNLFIFMTQKLYSFVQNKCCLEGVDSTMMQEVLLGGHLYLRILKEKLQIMLNMIQRKVIKKEQTTKGYKIDLAELEYFLKYANSIDKGMCNFLATGSINTPSGLGIMQMTGLVIVAENINRARYMSHFRSVHRGSFFQEMRTTEPRQLLPDAWGFICPVHTPDGTPCGLLNHLTKYCKISPNINNDPKLINICLRYGMIPLENRNFEKRTSFWYNVFLDGKVIGFVIEKQAKDFTNTLRKLKIDGKFPTYTEIALVPVVKLGGGQYPGIYLFTTSSRFMRPVFNIQFGQIEYIGSFEQIYLEVAVTKEEIIPNVSTHLEISETAFLSNLACLIPMPDYNQSPRNMYQCQMAKQTMGTPCHNYSHIACHKLYRLQTPATPLFRPVHHDLMDMDDFPMGTNAIVAVISYTGYDMEDAMVINKASYERGFASGMIYKSDFIELEYVDSYFGIKPNAGLEKYLDSDGLPSPGSVIKHNEPYCCFFDSNTQEYKIKKWNNVETAYVENVKMCGTVFKSEKIKACITYRLQRNPSVGDKFASRAGQKGICSKLWPPEDLPFSNSGMVPDVLFNPHGFPSRMTIAMMIEQMAGKAASTFGHVYDATPFRFNEEDTAIDYFGRLLEIAGYNYYGKETMYSGITGEEFEAQIYLGVIHYQRLRHMVSDKWQVRRTGPVDIVTNQPIKGRRRDGGIRFGEMERDALLSHGASFLLQDRLFHCSDKHTALICRNCGNLLSAIAFKLPYVSEICKMCQENSQIESIQIPYIFKYFVSQLASLNIKVKLNLKDI